MSQKKISDLSLEKEIKRLYYVEQMTTSQIGKELGLPRASIERWIRDDRLKNYSDNRLEAIARSDDFNALSLITNLFDSAAYAAKELAMTAIVGQMLREEISGILAEEGIEGLVDDKYEKLLNLWFRNAEKLTKMSANVPKFIDSYINLYTQVLDVQRQVSYVRALTDALSKVSPETHRLVIQEMNKDVAAKAVMNSLNSEDIAAYWQEKNTVVDAKFVLTAGE